MSISWDRVERFLSTLPARGATVSQQVRRMDRDISIHAPREGSDRRIRRDGRQPSQFLSTLPARGATHVHRDLRFVRDISIHAPREGSDRLAFLRLRKAARISIHAPREGSDFLATRGCLVQSISIHAPREGSDFSPYAV